MLNILFCIQNFVFVCTYVHMFSYSIFKVSCLVLCSSRLLNIAVVKLHLKVQAKKKTIPIEFVCIINVQQ
jgi:hypothetical protein